MPRRYTDEDRAAALAAAASCMGPDISERSALTAAARRLEMPETTLRRWWQKAQEDPDWLAELRREKKTELATQFADFAKVAMGVATRALSKYDGMDAPPVKLPDLVKLVTAAAIAADKTLSLRGEAPGQGEQVLRVIDERARAAPTDSPSRSGGDPPSDFERGAILRPGVWASVGQDDARPASGD